MEAGFRMGSTPLMTASITSTLEKLLAFGQKVGQKEEK